MSKSRLIDRAEQLVKNNHGILYKRCISILETGIKRATNLLDYSDLEDFVPMFEKKYMRLKFQLEQENRRSKEKKIQDITLLFKSYTKEMLFKQLENCTKESLKLKKKWDSLRRDERTQRKATISNRADANAKEMMLIHGERFNQCRSLFLKSTDATNMVNYIENFSSIDREEKILNPKNSSTKLQPETEFWAHCSNLQAWSENGYDSRLLHRNLAFPLLKKLTEVGDMKANRIFKEEIVKLLQSGYANVVEYLIREGYTQFLKGEELLYAVLVEEEAEILLELEKSLKVENKENLWLALDLEHELAPCFLVQNRHVVGLDLFKCGLKKLPESIGDLKYLQILSARYNRLEKLPESLNNLPDLKEIHVDNNNMKSIPSSLKYLIK